MITNGAFSNTSNTSANTANTDLNSYELARKIDPNNTRSGFGSWNIPTLVETLNQSAKNNVLQTMTGLMGGDFEPMKSENQGTQPINQSRTQNIPSPGTGPAAKGF